MSAASPSKWPVRGAAGRIGWCLRFFAAAALARRDGSAADGIHLLWTAPPGTGYSLDGWDIRRRDASGRPKVACRALSGPELEVLHRVLRLHTGVADFSVRQVPGPLAPSSSTEPPPHPTAYGIRLPQPHRVVEVHAGVPAALAIALRAGKAVAARALTARRRAGRRTLRSRRR